MGRFEEWVDEGMLYLAIDGKTTVWLVVAAVALLGIGYFLGSM